MRSSVAVIAALVATAAAHTGHTVHTTVDLTITSCPPGVSSCPGKPTSAPEPHTVVHTVDVTVTSCGPAVTSCPGKPEQPETHPVGSPSVPSMETHPVPTSQPAKPSPAPAPPVEHPPPPPAGQSPSTYAPYPTTKSVITMVTSSGGPIGTATGTGVLPPKNTTSTSPPIVSFTGAASSVSASFGAVAGLAAMAAFFMA